MLSFLIIPILLCSVFFLPLHLKANEALSDALIKLAGTSCAEFNTASSEKKIDYFIIARHGLVIDYVGLDEKAYKRAEAAALDHLESYCQQHFTKKFGDATALHKLRKQLPLKEPLNDRQIKRYLQLNKHVENKKIQAMRHRYQKTDSGKISSVANKSCKDFQNASDEEKIHFFGFIRGIMIFGGLPSDVTPDKFGRYEAQLINRFIKSCSTQSHFNFTEAVNDASQNFQWNPNYKLSQQELERCKAISKILQTNQSLCF